MNEKIYHHYLFEDLDEGEFLVGAEDIEEAWGIATFYFNDVEYIGELEDWEAEASGLDEF